MRKLILSIFPQFLEGSPPMSPPSGDYSKSCSNLTRYILSKMKENFKKHKNVKTTKQFAEKIKKVWTGVLEENFVLSLINRPEIEVKYDIDNRMSNWKVQMESYMEDILQEFCGVIEADFKRKDSNLDALLTTLQEELEVNSHTANHKEVKNF